MFLVKKSGGGMAMVEVLCRNGRLPNFGYFKSAHIRYQLDTLCCGEGCAGHSSVLLLITGRHSWPPYPTQSSRRRSGIVARELPHSLEATTVCRSPGRRAVQEKKKV